MDHQKQEINQQLLHQQVLIKMATLNSQVCSCHVNRVIKTVIITAAQMWCLRRYLPLLIGSFIHEGHQHWENFLTLLSIMDYVFAPVITFAKTDFISGLTEDFLHDFTQLYPERRLTPKMHYMVHLSSWIRRYK